MLTKKRPLCKIESNIDGNLFQNLLLIKMKQFCRNVYNLKDCFVYFFVFSNIEHTMQDVIHPQSHYDKFTYNHLRNMCIDPLHHHPTRK